VFDLRNTDLRWFGCDGNRFPERFAEKLPKMQRLELIDLSYNQLCRSGLLSWLDRILKSHAGLRITESFDAKRRDEKNELTKLYHPRLVLNE
jgi:hypothetical protein